ncbi:citrate synthase [Eubacteriales bacterium OttesenSCG-928-G02]|nr:citrate synthase [Eubacteriales bacterium OttesenSCG-928-G02]
MNKENSKIINEKLELYCEKCKNNLEISEDVYSEFNVKRGLRNKDGTGVIAGATNISNVHGYIINEYEKLPDHGELLYRGIDVNDIINSCTSEDRFGFEEVIWLLLFGSLPNKDEIEKFSVLLDEFRELPDTFIEDMIIKAPSPNVMNKMARSVLALYSYDDNPDDISFQNIFRQSIELISRISTIMVNAYQVKKRYYDHESLFFHVPISGLSIAENILSTMRMDRKFTRAEAKLLDICLILHAEHGGGNNSTFACRVLSSSGTDTYSAVAAGIGALKGPRHGGANIKVIEMLDYMKAGISDYNDDDEIYSYLKRIFAKEEGDKSGLIYGLGHAVYTKSDPRAVILKQNAMTLAKEKGYEQDFKLLDAVERLGPQILASKKGASDNICANVDLYSGLVYRMLDIPPELYTPLFAVARMAGLCAHRIEEATTCKKIIRPGYKSLIGKNQYIPLNERK